MKHKHYEMIVAKAANVELVVFCKQSDGWVRCSQDGVISWSYDLDYFLCLPEHKEACLHWLNGGLVEFKDASAWNNYFCSGWGMSVRWMKEDCEIRAKPKKEKRWIAISDKENHIFFFDTKSEVEKNISMYYSKDDYQILEIEIEV